MKYANKETFWSFHPEVCARNGQIFIPQYRIHFKPAMIIHQRHQHHHQLLSVLWMHHHEGIYFIYNHGKVYTQVEGKENESSDKELTI